jgi:hypothetical protein
LVRMRDDVSDVERRRDVAAHTFAISMRNGRSPIPCAIDE